MKILIPYNSSNTLPAKGNQNKISSSQSQSKSSSKVSFFQFKLREKPKELHQWTHPQCNKFIYVQYTIITHACIFFYSKPRKYNIFFVSYLGNMFCSWSISFNFKNFAKLLSIHPFRAFKLNNFKVADNHIKLLYLWYNFRSKSGFKESYTCAFTKF